MPAAYDPREHEPQLRVSDEEREAVAATVRSALDAGRLRMDELDDRLSAVYNAKTHADLAAVLADLVPRRPQPPPPSAPSTVAINVGGGAPSMVGQSDRTILPAFLLCFFVGVFGVHRFYAGKVGSGIAMLVLTITLVGIIVSGVWAFVDLIVLAVGAFRDGYGRPMREWT